MKLTSFYIDKTYSSIYLFLKEHGFSENFIKNLRKEMGNILINEQPVNIRHPLLANDILKIKSNPNKKTTIMHCILPLDIVYEDAYYLLINKPSGLSCMPNKSHYDKNLAGAICAYMSKQDDNFVLRILNRLDKDTAGLILVAKDSISMKEVRMKKTYMAICHGKINAQMTIDKPIKTVQEKNINKRTRIISEDGKKAITHLAPLCSNKKFSMIELKLEQGRTHQIRLHLSSINHPLVGDEIYGQASPLINHTALICNKLSFYHYVKKEWLDFEIEPPKDFQKVIKTISE